MVRETIDEELNPKEEGAEVVVALYATEDVVVLAKGVTVTVMLVFQPCDKVMLVAAAWIEEVRFTWVERSTTDRPSG